MAWYSWFFGGVGLVLLIVYIVSYFVPFLLPFRLAVNGALKSAWGVVKFVWHHAAKPLLHFLYKVARVLVTKVVPALGGILWCYSKIGIFSALKKPDKVAKAHENMPNWKEVWSDSKQKMKDAHGEFKNRKGVRAAWKERNNPQVSGDALQSPGGAPSPAVGVAAAGAPMAAGPMAAPQGMPQGMPPTMYPGGQPGATGAYPPVAAAKEGEAKTPEEMQEEAEKKEEEHELEEQEREIETQTIQQQQEASTAAQANIGRLKAAKLNALSRCTDPEQRKEIEKEYNHLIGEAEKEEKEQLEEIEEIGDTATAKKKKKEKALEKGGISAKYPWFKKVFIIVGVLLLISLGFPLGVIGDWVRVILVSALFLLGVIFVIGKLAMKKKFNAKTGTIVIIAALLIFSVFPGPICEWSSGWTLLSFTCVLEESVAQPIRSMTGSIFSTITTQVKNWVFNLFRQFLPDNPLIKNLKTQSCYPFCTDPSGRDTKWHGLEVARFEIIPHVIYSHQQFSIVVEFENKGKTPAIFTPPQPKQGGVKGNFWAQVLEKINELFGLGDDAYEFDGSLTLGCTRECELSLGLGQRLAEWIHDEESLDAPNSAAKCMDICPLNAATVEVPYVVGGCSDLVTYQIGDENDQETLDELGMTTSKFIETFLSGGDALEDGDLIPGMDCTLEPGDILRMTWYGLSVSEGANIPMGDTNKPDVTMGLKYTYTPANDLIGSLSMMSAETQVAGAEQKSIGRIANKISQSYSPTGPLMMAMGTAEKQVVGGSPMFLMVQFTNKGRGTIPGISTNYQLLYMPEDFVISSKGRSCDFVECRKSGDGWLCGEDEELTELTYENKSCDWQDPDCQFYPGPTFIDDYKVYKPKEPIRTVGKGQDPLYNPMYTCVVKTPRESELKSYVMKYRIVSYAYREEKSADIKIIGTTIDESEAPQTSVPTDMSEGQGENPIPTTPTDTSTSNSGQGQGGSTPASDGSTSTSSGDKYTPTGSAGEFTHECGTDDNCIERVFLDDLAKRGGSNIDVGYWWNGCYHQAALDDMVSGYVTECKWRDKQQSGQEVLDTDEHCKYCCTSKECTQSCCGGNVFASECTSGCRK